MSNQQAAQIAAALVLHTDPDPVPLSCPTCDVLEYPCPTALALLCPHERWDCVKGGWRCYDCGNTRSDDPSEDDA